MPYPYVSPGAAASDAIEHFMVQRQQETHQKLLDSLAIERENRLARAEELEIQARREKIAADRMDRAESAAERREKTAETKREKEHEEVGKDVAGLVQGDIPDDNLVRRANKAGVPIRLGPTGSVTIPQGQQNVTLPGQTVDASGAEAPPQPVALPGAAPTTALRIAPAFLGTPAQQKESDQRTRISDIIYRLSTAEPGSPEWSRLATEYEMVAGKALPAGAFRGAAMGGDVNSQIHTVLLNGKPTDVSYHPREDRFYFQGKDVTAQVGHYEKPPAPDRVLIQSGTGYIPRTDAVAAIRRGESVPLAETNSTRTMQEGATMLRPHVVELQTLAADLEKRNLFGPVMSRIRQLSEKVGTAGEPEEVQQNLAGLSQAIQNDPELNKDRAVGRFATTLALMASGAGRVHGGARGGGSIQMIDYMKGVLSASGSLPMFLGRLDALDSYLKGYAGGPQGVSGGQTPAKRTYYDANGNKIEK